MDRSQTDFLIDGLNRELAAYRMVSYVMHFPTHTQSQQKDIALKLRKLHQSHRDILDEFVLDKIYNWTGLDGTGLH